MKPMIRVVLIAWVVIAALAGQRHTAQSAEKSAKLVPVRLAYVSRSILDMPYIIARDRGFFREEGLETEFVFMKAIQTVTGTKMKSQAAGKMGFSTSGVGDLIVAAL